MKLIKYILLTIALIFLFQESKGQCDASYTYTSGSLTVNFISGFSGVVPTFNWDFGDGNTGTGISVNHTYATPGIYTVRLIKIKPGCTDTAIHLVAVDSIACVVTAGIYYDGTNSFTQNYRFNGSGNNPTTTYLWHFGDGQTSTLRDPVHVYTNPDYYHISLIATDTSGCSSSAPLANYSCIQADFQDSVVGLTHYLQSTSVGTSPSTNYNWDFGDGNFSSLPNPIHTYATAGNYRVSLMVNDTNCFDSTSKSIMASAACPVVASFTESSVGLTTTFTNTSSGTSPFTTYFWRFGDGVTSTLENPVHTYTTTGSYNVGLEVTDTIGGYCFDSVYNFVMVVGPPCSINASFSETITGNTVAFNSTTTGISGVATYNWGFSDGGTLLGTRSGASTFFTFPSQSIYTVSLIVSDSICSDTNTRRIAVSANVFTPNGDGIDDVLTLPCSGTIANIYNSTGILVKTLAVGSPFWDGSNNLGGNEPTGLYFILCSGSSTPVSVTLIR